MERFHFLKQVYQEVDENLDFYTEKSTNLIYEATFFDEFVIVRPATPMFYNAIRQISWADFHHEFSEFLGDHRYLRAQIDGTEEDADEAPEDIELI